MEWIDEITEMLTAKNFNVNENAIISKAKQIYDVQQVKRIEDQLKRK